MHEISLCKSILNIVLDYAKKQHAHKIRKIYIEVGELVRLDHSAMRFGFNIVSSNTLAEKAHLEFTVIPAKIFCKACQAYSAIKQYGDFCTSCGKPSTTIVSGEECNVKSMEIE